MQDLKGRICFLLQKPTKRYADVIIPEGGGNDVAIDLMVTKIKTILETDSIV